MQRLGKKWQMLPKRSLDPQWVPKAHIAQCPHCPMPILGASVSRDFNAPTDLRQFQRLMFLEAGGGVEAHFSVGLVLRKRTTLYTQLISSGYSLCVIQAYFIATRSHKLQRPIEICSRSI